ncbi:GntR family transcriptional regulator [Rhodococcus sp. 15-1154-1]|nr:GntR family transcriptional regulator [Rhodococcus sp. 15-1154-1]
MTAIRFNSVAEIVVDSGIDLHLDLAPTGSRRSALGRALRDAIATGRLEPGTRLPSYRALAADLGVARNTVAETYGELVSEGWLDARRGSGTRVAHRGASSVRAASSTVRPELRPEHDLRPGRPDQSAFPRAAWMAAARRAVSGAPVDAFGPGDPHGRLELRRALAGYLARTRGVRSDPRRILVCSGFSQTAQILTSVVSGPFAVESYGLPFHRRLLDTSGPTVPIGVDEHGGRTHEPIEAAALVLTPSHQFPTGVSLHPQRRTAAVDWARATDGLVVEDDYDGEFRYDRTPVGAMQGLDPDRVLYAGSISKSLSPGVRVGWMAVPEHLLDPILDAKGVREATVSALDQLTLADLITTGAYDRHVRAMRLKYRRRRDALVDALRERVPEIGTMGIAAGLQAVLTLPPGSESDVLAGASEAGLAVEGLGWFRHPSAAEVESDVMPDGILVGFSAPSDRAFPRAVETLVSVLELTTRGRRRG